MVQNANLPSSNRQHNCTEIEHSDSTWENAINHRAINHSSLQSAKKMDRIGITATYVPDISIGQSEKKIQQWLLLSNVSIMKQTSAYLFRREIYSIICSLTWKPRDLAPRNPEQLAAPQRHRTITPPYHSKLQLQDNSVPKGISCFANIPTLTSPRTFHFLVSQFGWLYASITNYQT